MQPLSPHLSSSRVSVFRLLAGSIITLCLAAPGSQGSERPDRTVGALDTDPILEALLESQAAQMIEGPASARRAQLNLEIAEIGERTGTRTLGRFNAPIRPGRTARLKKRVNLPASDGIGPIQLDLDIRIIPRMLNSRNVSIDLESRTRRSGDHGPWLVRRAASILREGRSTLLEVYQLPGLRRRLLLSLSWSAIEPDPLQDLLTLPPFRMIDMVVELVREEKGTALTLRREILSAGLGTEASSLIRLAGGLEQSDGIQLLEVRLRPQAIESGDLLLDIAVRGSLAAESEEGSLNWIDHRENVRMTPGSRFRVDLGESGEDLAYRLEIRTYF